MMVASPVSPRVSSAIHNRSCETMAEVADRSVDLVVTSPPYWVDPADEAMQPALLRDSAKETPKNYDDLLELLDRCFAEVHRVLKPGGFACVNVAGTIVKGVVYPLPFDLLVRLRDAGWLVKEDLIWRRWRGWDRRAGTLIQKPYPGYFHPNRLHEYVLVFRKPGARIWEGRSEADKERSVVADAVNRDGFYALEMANTIWNILPVQPQRKAADNGEHPCPYPEELAYRLISLYSYRGDTVLDPFCGSGTTAKVAHRLGRNFVGYETNPKFAFAARRRVEDGAPIRRERRVARFEKMGTTP